MEDKPSTLSPSSTSSTYAAKTTTQDFAVEGQKHLEETIGAAFLILSAMNDELCNPSLWSTTAPPPPPPPNAPSGMSNGHHSNGDLSLDSSSASQSHPRHLHSNCSDIGGGALDEARLRFKSSVASLKSILVSISNAQQARAAEADPTSTSVTPDEQMETEQLEEQAAILRKKLEDKNKHLKGLIDQLRDLLADISTWQSPCAL